MMTGSEGFKGPTEPHAPEENVRNLDLLGQFLAAHPISSKCGGMLPN